MILSHKLCFGCCLLWPWVLTLVGSLAPPLFLVYKKTSKTSKSSIRRIPATTTTTTRIPRYFQDDRISSTVTDRPIEKRTSSKSSWVPRLAYVVVAQIQHSLQKRDEERSVGRTMGDSIGKEKETTESESKDERIPSVVSLGIDSIPVSTAASIAEILSDLPPEIPEVRLQLEDMIRLEKTSHIPDSFFQMPASGAPTSTESSPAMWNLTQDIITEEEYETSEVPEFDSGVIKRLENETGISISAHKNTTVETSPSEEVLDINETDTIDEQKSKELNTYQQSSIVLEEDNTEQSIQRRAAEISHSFYAKDFRPAWFAKNPHLQTITGTLARQESMYFPTTGNLILSKFQWDHRERIETPDGDFFDVDWKFATQPVEDATVLSKEGTYFLEPHSRTPLVLICHGLQSNTQSPLTKDMAISFNNVGMDVVAINFRGCSGEPNHTPMGYHLSYTDDLELMVQRISRQYPGRSIYLSGFSLGANVVTKFLADIGSKAVIDYNICGAAANAVPFDLTRTQSINRPGFSGRVYGDKLCDSLKNRVYDSMDAGVEYNFTRDELANCTTCKEFDELVVCSVYEDFDDADDYHRKSSTFDRLHQIMVPQFILQALDDPFMEGSTNPENDPNMACRIKYTEHGGHCGYIFHSEERDKVETSFMPRELARFVEHVHKVRTGQIPSKVALQQYASPPSDDYSSENSDERKEQAYVTAKSFETMEYNPAPWARNEHLQTIAGTLFRHQSKYVPQKSSSKLLEAFLQPRKEFEWDERQRIFTPDNDFFDVDWKHVDNEGKSDKPLVLICHGLQSDSSSPLAQDMAKAFNNQGMDAACINFRGCSGEINKTPVGYHLGFTDDLKQMIDYVNKDYPGRRIYLSGFSLGANVVAACLAEFGASTHRRNVYGAAVNAVPFDMPKAQLNLNKNGITKSLYGTRLLKSMIDRIEESYDQIKFHFPKEEAAKCRTIMDMENLVIAPVFGFRDAHDYYRKASTLYKVDSVAVPALVIQAKDDPFFKGQSTPELLVPGRPLRIQLTEHGGHCGYVLHSINDDHDSPETSWMPTQLARFLKHVDDTFQPKSDATLKQTIS